MELDEPPVVDDAVDHGDGHLVVPECYRQWIITQFNQSIVPARTKTYCPIPASLNLNLPHSR